MEFAVTEKIETSTVEGEVVTVCDPENGGQWATLNFDSIFSSPLPVACPAPCATFLAMPDSLRLRPAVEHIDLLNRWQRTVTEYVVRGPAG
jgi:hypothetical protein